MKRDEVWIQLSTEHFSDQIHSEQEREHPLRLGIVILQHLQQSNESSPETRKLL